MFIDTRSSVPLHAQLEGILAQRIERSDFPPGARLPSEEELTLQYAVSRTTVRTAIQSLISGGVLEIRRGKGTFVCVPVVTQEVTALTGFIGEGSAPGKAASETILDRRIAAASETVARQLALRRGATVTRIQRVRHADGSPVSFDETYLPDAPDAKDAAGDREMFEAEYRLAAVQSHGTVARALGIDAGTAIFLIERTRFSHGHRPVDYQRLYFRGDHIRLATRLSRR